MSGPSKMLTPKQMKFAQLMVYGVEGTPVSKGEAAKIAGYGDWYKELSPKLHVKSRLFNRYI